MGQQARIAVAGALGNLLEWYDFGLYGLLAPVLAERFFPAHDPIAALLAVYGGFAAGFAMRPLGAWWLGLLGDRRGRRYVLILSVTLMGVATSAVGMLPTYAQAGLAAPALLILVRLFQGVSVGGEFVDSVTYLVETSPVRRRGIAGSVANIGSTAGMLLAAGVSSLVLSGHGRGDWRIAFLLGGVLAAAAYFVRRGLPETPIATPTTRQEAPLRQAIQRQPWLLLATLAFTSGYGIANYLSMVFLPAWAHEFHGMAEAQALRINTAGQGLALFVVPLAAWVSDRWISRRALLFLTFAAEAVLAWEAYRLAGTGAVGFWAAQLALAFLLAVVMGTAPAMLGEQFPAEYRVSAHAVAFNLGIGIAGGTAPMIALALIHSSGNPMMAAIYQAVACALAAAAALALHNRSREPLD